MNQDIAIIVVSIVILLVTVLFPLSIVFTIQGIALCGMCYAAYRIACNYFPESWKRKLHIS